MVVIPLLYTKAKNDVATITAVYPDKFYGIDLMPRIHSWHESALVPVAEWHIAKDAKRITVKDIFKLILVRPLIVMVFIIGAVQDLVRYIKLRERK